MANKYTLSDCKVWVPGDIHFPEHDHEALQAVLGYVEAEKVTHIVLQGDTFDTYGANRYGTSAKRLHSRGYFRHEVEAATPYLNAMAGLVGSDNIHIICGNHEKRLYEIAQREPGFGDASWWEILGLNTVAALRKSHFYGPGDSIRIGPYKVCHGDYTSGSLASAGGTMAVLKRNPMQSTVFGHSHRLGMSMYTIYEHDRPIIRAAYNLGHMSKPANQDYAQDHNWQLGGGIMTHSYDREDWTTEVELHTVVGGRVVKI